LSPTAEALDLECGALTRFLVASEPTPYVRSKYREAHEADLGLDVETRFDQVLLDLLRGSALLRRPAAAYARTFLPKGAVQAKLIVLLAILESCAPSHGTIDDVPRGGAVNLALGLVLRGAAGAVALLAAVVLLHPVALVQRGRPPL